MILWIIFFKGHNFKGIRILKQKSIKTKNKIKTTIKKKLPSKQSFDKKSKSKTPF